jgi:hypothetical protein
MSSPTAWHQALAVTVEVRRLVALADVDAILLTHQRGQARLVRSPHSVPISASGSSLNHAWPGFHAGNPSAEAM